MMSITVFLLKPDQTVAEPILMQLERLLGLLVAGPLANLTAEHDASGFGSREAGLHAFADEISASR